MLVRLLLAAALFAVAACSDPPAEVEAARVKIPKAVKAPVPDAVPADVATAPTPPAAGIPTAPKPTPEKGSGW